MMSRRILVSVESLERLRFLLRADISHKLFVLQHAKDKNCIRSAAHDLSVSLIAMEELEHD